MDRRQPDPPQPGGDRRRGVGIRFALVGTIAHAGFASGDRFVVGWWASTPIGPMRDVMWARPDGERVLLVDRDEAARFITGIYDFDRVEVVDIAGAGDDCLLEVSAGQVQLTLRAGAGWRLPLGRFRPPALTRWVEGPIARAVMGVRTYGVSPSGVREWYRADEYRPLVSAQASVAGADLGALVPFVTPAGFGFSEPPRRPALVKVRPLLEDPTGRLDALLAGVVR